MTWSTQGVVRDCCIKKTDGHNATWYKLLSKHNIRIVYVPTRVAMIGSVQGDSKVTEINFLYLD